MEFQSEITIEDRDDYLKIVVCGAASLEKVLTAIDEADKIFHDNPFSEILYDFRTMHGGFRAVDKIRIGLYAARFSQYAIKVALLYQPEHVQTLRFLEIYLQDRGIQFRLFSNEDQALQWLAA